MPKTKAFTDFTEDELRERGFLPPAPQTDEDGNEVPNSQEHRVPMRISAEDFARLPDEVAKLYGEAHEDDGHHEAAWVRG